MSCSTEMPTSTESPVRTASTVVSHSIDGSHSSASCSVTRQSDRFSESHRNTVTVRPLSWNSPSVNGCVAVLRPFGRTIEFGSSLKTSACPTPHSLSRSFEKRNSGHPLMVEGKSRPEGAEHCASSYIVDSAS